MQIKRFHSKWFEIGNNRAARSVLSKKHPDWSLLKTKPTDLNTSRHGGEHDVELVASCQADLCPKKKYTRMSAPNLQPARLVLVSKASESVGTATHVEHSNQIPFGIKLSFTVVVAVLLHPVIGDNWARKANRLIPRDNNGQLVEKIIFLRHVSRPIPSLASEMSPTSNPTSP